MDVQYVWGFFIVAISRRLCVHGCIFPYNLILSRMGLISHVQFARRVRRRIGKFVRRIIKKLVTLSVLSSHRDFNSTTFRGT